MAVQATDTTSSTPSSTSSESFDQWYTGAKSQLLDMNMSDDDLMKYIGQQFESTDGTSADSEAKRSALQQLIDLRSQITTAMSNMLQTLSEAARSVIGNIRT